MKLITLNTWGGRVKEPLHKFIKEHSNVDIWCFQEVYRDNYHINDDVNRSDADLYLYGNIQKYLKNHGHDFCQVLLDVYGMATFVHSGIKILEKGETFIAKGDYRDMSDLKNRDHHRKLQWLEVEIGGRKVLIVNTHLTHRPEGKQDSDKRLKQSKIIVEFLSMFDCPKILCGDFNLLPDTESLKIIENSGLTNLVKQYNIQSTRTVLYKKPLKFADYIFVSSEIKVNDLKVLPDVVSDHSPLLLDFDI